MKKSAVLLFFAVMAISDVVHAADAKIDVVGISVGKKLTQAQKDVFLFSQDGTRLQLTIALPGQVFIGADREACKFKEFSDDKGTALFDPLGHEPQTDDWLGSFGPKFSDDGKVCGLSVEAPGLPAKDATKLKFSGDLVLRCGAAPRTVEQKNVVLKKGSKITVGPVQFDISSVKPDGSGLSVDLHAKRSLERIIKIAFYDAAGKSIGNTRNGMESSEFLGNYNITETYNLSRKVPTATIRISFFEKVENITVPVQVETGLGITP